MKGERLLERIRRLEKDPGSRFKPVARGDLSASIRRHLACLLNTRQGSAEFDAEFGLPDLTDMPSSISGRRISSIQRAIHRLIAKYEPRLDDVRVSFVEEEEQGPHLRFRIEGAIGDLPESTRSAVFEARVESGGKVDLKG